MINISFTVSKKDAAMFITSVEHVINTTTSQATKKKLLKILQEIKFDFWRDDKIIMFVTQMLQQVTREPIYLSSKLEGHLGLTSVWISRVLYSRCNNIILRIMQLSGKTKPIRGVTKTEASKCKTVKDIVNLIRKTYEKA